MKEYTLCFLDSDMNISAVCGDYISLRFTEEFSDEGELECILAHGHNIPPVDSLVTCGGFIYVIEQIDTDTARGQVCVRGHGILSFLGRRCIPLPLPLHRSLEQTVGYLANNYAADALPAPLEVGEIGDTADSHIVVDAGNLLVRLKQLASSVMKGLRLTYSTAEGKFIFELYDRTDRRTGSTTPNDALLLSERLGTLGSVSYSYDKSDYINRVKVSASSGTAGSYTVVTVNASSYTFPDGFDDSAETIRECFVRSGIGVSLYTSEDENGNEVFDRAGYQAAIQEYGRQYLAKHRVRRILRANLPLGSDAAVGDVCSLHTTAADVNAALITSKEYTVKSGRISCVASMTAIG